MKKSLLFFLIFFSISTLYSQISFQEQEVTSYTDNSRENRTADIDNDGDMDIVTFGSSNIDWYENNFPAQGFKPKQNITTLSGSAFIVSIEISDFDGDGDLDVLGTDSFGDKLFLHTNLDGQGTFSALQVLKTIDAIQFVKHIDMDKDGDKDLVCKSIGIGYYENTNQANNYSVFHVINNQPINVRHNIQINDFNNDGYPDIFYKFDTSLQWIKNNAAVTFSPLTVISISNNVFYFFDSRDIDNDGDVDLVGNVELNGNEKLVCYLNNGLGVFTEQTLRQNLTGDIIAVKLDDIDNDSKVDIIVSITSTNGEYFSDLYWYKNNGSTTFTNQPAIELKVRAIYQIETFNLNNDGNKDIITSSYSHRTTTYQNNGSGTFAVPKYPAAANLSASCAVVGDIDGDGDIDIVTSSASEGKIYWYKKSDTDTTYGNQIIINHNVSSAKKVALADMDGDGDLDIVSISGPSTSGYEDKVSWYKNLDGLGNFGTQINIPIGGYDSPDGLAVYDVDADGDQDIVTSLINNWPATGDKIIWYANNGFGSFSGEQIIAGGIIGIRVLKEADIDNDGDFDLVFASAQESKIGWFENLNGIGSFGSQRIITTNAFYVADVAIADLDSDGDKDLVYMSNGSVDDILWQPNQDGLGNFGASRIINSNVDINGASTLFAGDIDNDSDIDIIVGENTKTTWSENLYGQGNFEPPKTISSTVSNPSSSLLMDQDNDGDMDLLLASLGSNKVLWYKNQGVTKNTIKGVVRLDIEGNGCGTNDALLPNILVSTTNGTSTEATLTFRNEFAGQYRLYAGQGNFQTSVVHNLPNYFMLTPLTQSSSFTNFGTIATANFCIEPIGQIDDLNVALYPLGEARPGFNTSYQLVYKNIGTTTLTGQATLEYNNTKIQFLNASTTPSSQTANTLNYNFTNLAPFEVRTMILNFNVFTPPTTNISENLLFTATVTPASSDHTTNDNTLVLNQQVIGSYDPNDITCLEGDQVLIANADKYLHYVIRFQNTGTASAINVKVQYLLDQKLDWTTIQLEGMSHNGMVTIKDQNLVEFIFNNIYLPQSAANEVDSHGFITFKIKPKKTVVAGDIVNATANIYFDFNPPITTNTAATAYTNLLGTDSFAADRLIVYPNPVKDQLLITSDEEILQFEIHNILGSKVLEEKNKNVINISNLESGMYLISITTEKGNCTKKFIKK